MAEMIEFVKERETKRTIRYQELSDNPIVGTLYVQKWYAKGAERLLITISKGEQDD